MFWAFTSTAWRSWLFLTVTFGGFAGVRGGLDTGSVRFGIVSGAISGIFFATVMLLTAVRRPLSALRDLPGDFRVAVIRAVRRGASVHDPRSAEALNDTRVSFDASTRVPSPAVAEASSGPWRCSASSW
jgi:hypothetical protein